MSQLQTDSGDILQLLANGDFEGLKADAKAMKEIAETVSLPIDFLGV